MPNNSLYSYSPVAEKSRVFTAERLFTPPSPPSTEHCGHLAARVTRGVRNFLKAAVNFGCVETRVSSSTRGKGQLSLQPPFLLFTRKDIDC